jgi:hypothetical protein
LGLPAAAAAAAAVAVVVVGGSCRDLSIQIIQVEPYRHNLTNVYISSLGLLYINKAKETKQEITQN